MSLDVAVQYADQSPDLPALEQIKGWVAAACNGRINDAELSIRIVDEDESACLNRQYRQRDGSTNTLAFPAGDVAAVYPRLLGDVVICAPLAYREAKDQAKDPEGHFAHLIVHGTLHLLGYDHIEPQEAARMETLEREILHQLGYPDPYEQE